MDGVRGSVARVVATAFDGIAQAFASIAQELRGESAEEDGAAEDGELDEESQVAKQAGAHRATVAKPVIAARTGMAFHLGRTRSRLRTCCRG